MASTKEMTFYDLAKQDYLVLEEMISKEPVLLTKKDTNDRYLLHWAALSGRLLLIEHIMKTHKEQLHEIDDTNASPLILATLGGHLESVKLLIDSGSNINLKNWQGHSALQYACSKGYQEIVQLLLEKDADVNIQDNRNDTPLHRLASLGRSEIMKLLLNHQKKPNLNSQNAEGDTPLHLACADEQNTCALLLVEHGASIEVMNKEKFTPLDLCKPGLRRQIKTKLGIQE